MHERQMNEARDMKEIMKKKYVRDFLLLRTARNSPVPLARFKCSNYCIYLYRATKKLFQIVHCVRVLLTVVDVAVDNTHVNIENLGNFRAVSRTKNTTLVLFYSSLS